MATFAVAISFAHFVPYSKISKMPAPDLYRHILAAIAYRFQKAVRGAAPDYPGFEAGAGVRRPVEIVNHMTSVLEFARAMLTGTDRLKPDPKPWAEEIDRFHDLLATLDELLKKKSYEETTLKKVLQGPLSDVLTHIGQLATLRRLSGDPLPGESYVKANIQTGKTGKDQELQS